MTQFLVYLKLAWESFRFIKKARERRLRRLAFESLERQKEREHQRLMLEGIGGKLVQVVQTNQEGLLKIAEALTKQSDVFNTWLKGFQTSPEAEPSRVIREEDEWRMEQDRLREEDPAAYMAALPPEFQLAFAMSKLDANAPQAGDPNPGFDREGRDVI